MTKTEQRLASALNETINAALDQLAAMGKRYDPSPRLQDAIEAARSLLAEVQGK